MKIPSGILAFKRLLLYVNDFFFPSACAGGCGKNTGMSTKVCKGCYSKIKDFPALVKSEDITDRAVFWDESLSSFYFEDLISDAVHQYKSGKRTDLSVFFADKMVEDYHISGMEADCVTSPPPSSKKRRKRGFDPAALIAKKFANKAGLKYIPMFYENKNRKEQKSLGSADRFINSIGRFSTIRDLNVNNIKIALIDDVTTTGATINECARILKKNGALKVFSLTAATVRVKDN